MHLFNPFGCLWLFFISVLLCSAKQFFKERRTQHYAMDSLLCGLICLSWWPLKDTNVRGLLFCCPCGEPNLNPAINNCLYMHRYFMSCVKYLRWLFAQLFSMGFPTLFCLMYPNSPIGKAPVTLHQRNMKC